MGALRPPNLQGAKRAEGFQSLPLGGFRG